jgi:hypothetical protein
MTAQNDDDDDNYSGVSQVLVLGLITVPTSFRVAIQRMAATPWLILVALLTNQQGASFGFGQERQNDRRWIIK